MFLQTYIRHAIYIRYAKKFLQRLLKRERASTFIN